ncbi:MAG: choice-of-anchor D domain-containing protein [Archangiaceae bacterium]|nr:choice-of-anchor D domain-containing protein [Archangiaceae bacterium]
MRLQPAVFLSLLSFAACRCEPPPTVEGLGEINIVFPLDGLMVSRPDGVYDFQGIAMGSTRTLQVTVRNVGKGPLDVDTLELVSGDGEVFTLPFQAGRVAASDSLSWATTFTAPVTADAQKSYGAHFKLTASNTETGKETADIELKGIAVKAECAMPDTLDFGGVAVGATEKRTVHFQNLTSLDAQGALSAITSSNGDYAAFHYGPGWQEGPILLPSGAMKDVTFTFGPTQTQTYSALVQLKAAEHCAAQPVKLIGLGVTSAVDCAATDFAWLPPGLTLTKQATLTNYALQDVVLTGLAATTNDFASGATTVTVPAAQRVMASGGGLMLQPGTVTLPVTFKPTKLGPLDAAITGNTNLGAQPKVTCTLSGKGGGPDIELKPSGTLDVGAVPYFPTAPAPYFITRRLTVQNLGVAPTPADVRANLHLGVNGVGPQFFRVTPKNADSLESEICVGVYDASNPDPGARCSNAPPSSYDPALGIVAIGAQALLDVPLRITPSAANKHMEWDVEVFSDDPDEPVSKLTVRAHSVTLPPCSFLVAPTNLQFGLVTPPVSRELTFQVRNLGQNTGEDCLVTHLDLAPGADSTFSLPDGELDQRTIAPGQSLSVKVRATGQGLATTTLRQVMGAVRVGISSPTFPQIDVPLTAFMGLSCLTIAPSDLDFGTVKKGCASQRRTFTVYNTCQAAVTLNGWSVSAGAGQPAGGPDCPGTSACPEFAFDGAAPVAPGAMLLAGATMPTTFGLRYHPLDLGKDMGAVTLDVTQNGTRVDQLITLTGVGDNAGLNTDVFSQDPRPKADILWVIDSSCSMRDEQLYLSQNFAATITYANSAVPGGIDYQMGVIDSDPNTATGGHLRGDPLNPKVLRFNTPNVEPLFRAKVQVGTAGSGNEHFADVAVRALTAPLVNTDNAGFLRPDAVLAVIAVTDAGDQSQLPTSVLMGLLRNIKGASKPNLFSYNVIGPFTPSVPPGCEYDDYVDTTLHNDLVTAFNGKTGQICATQSSPQTEWAQTLTAIGTTAFGYRDRFFLSSLPDMSQVPVFTVQLDGINVPPTDTTGSLVWSYDLTTNSVKFTAQFVPEPGQALTIAYHVLCN